MEGCLDIRYLFWFHNPYFQRLPSYVNALSWVSKSGSGLMRKAISERSRPFLLYAYAVPFFCWAFDVFTTYHAIASRIAVENNPLGWPLGIVGALLFYVPALVFCYLLLFRFRGRLACFSAVLITVLALFLSVMNLGAGLHNLQIMQM